MVELRNCYYCGKIKKAPFPRVCPVCHTITKWQNNKDCMDSTILAELRRWESVEQIHVPHKESTRGKK